MALPFFNPRNKKRDQIIAIDLGTRTTKAVHLSRKGDRFTLARYAIQDAPIYEKALSPDLLSEHLRSVVLALETRARQVTLAVGVGESLLRSAELPQIPVSDMRQMLKFNTKNYLQQDLPDYVFDCHIVPPREAPKADAPRGSVKFKVWVGGAKRQLVEDVQAATRSAGLLPDQMGLSSIGPINAFEMAFPEAFAKDVVALVDLGFKNSSISILSEGELMLHRVVAIGGDRLTAGLSEAMGISYAEAEGIKVGMPQEVESTLQPLISPLGRELRASVDFLEHQQDKTVAQIFVSGGASRSEFILQALQSEMMVACHSWNPTSFLELSLPPQQIGEVEQVAPQLTAAIGAAMSSF